MYFETEGLLDESIVDRSLKIIITLSYLIEICEIVKNKTLIC